MSLFPTIPRTVDNWTGPVVLKEHPEGCVAERHMTLDCANGDHDACLADWCQCDHHHG